MYLADGLAGVPLDLAEPTLYSFEAFPVCDVLGKTVNRRRNASAPVMSGTYVGHNDAVCASVIGRSNCSEAFLQVIKNKRKKLLRRVAAH
jgi:hypothetical protein